MTRLIPGSLIAYLTDSSRASPTLLALLYSAAAICITDQLKPTVRQGERETSELLECEREGTVLGRDDADRQLSLLTFVGRGRTDG